MVKYEIELDKEIISCMHCDFHKCSKSTGKVYCGLLGKNLSGGIMYGRNKDCKLKLVENKK